MGTTESRAPAIWETNPHSPAYYLGTQRTMRILWRLAIMEDGKEWTAVKPGQELIAKGKSFLTAFQYALQEWDWLSDD